MIIKTLLDTDFYKLLMLQFVWKYYPRTSVAWSVKNRTSAIRLTDKIDVRTLAKELNGVYDLRFQASELAYLADLDIFEPGFIDFLQSFDMSGSQYTLHADQKTGQYELSFHGLWKHTTLWEIYALAIINEMASVTSYTEEEDQEVAEHTLRQKLEKLKAHDLKFTDFGTRRRHSAEWQEKAIRIAMEYGVIAGTSNVHLAMKLGLTPIGTNAHELPMTLAAMARNDKELRESQYEVTAKWQELYPNRLTFLPDTFGTTQFLKNAPEYLLDWSSARPDSKDPFVGGDELIEWWVDGDRDPMTKTVVMADGLDVDISDVSDLSVNGTDIVAIAAHFKGRTNLAFGWGTNFTNDFRAVGKKAMSIVCKVSEVEFGYHAVKLSDNYNKATGEKTDIERYRRVFGTEGQHGAPVNV